MRKRHQTEMWKLLLRAWKQGPACQFEMASRYVQVFPQDAAGWIVLADGLGGTARYREAEASLRRAAGLISPESRWYVAVQWGHLYREKHDEKRAERWYRKALALKPSSEIHIFLGATLAKQGHFAEARKHHRRAVQLAREPDKTAASEAHLNLGLICRAERRYREAAVYLKKAIQLDPPYKIAREALQDVLRAIRFTRPANTGSSRPANSAGG